MPSGADALWVKGPVFSGETFLREKSMGYSHERYDTMVRKTFDRIMELSIRKGGEYSGDEDRLLNFRRLGAEQDLPMEVIWRVYAAKHWDAVGQYIKDLLHDKQRERMEPISGRIDDLIVYLLLLKAMVEERENIPSNVPVMRAG